QRYVYSSTYQVAPATSLLPPPSVSTISNVLQQTTTLIPTPPITIEASPITTIPDPLPAITQRVSALEKDVQELKEVDNKSTLIASLRFEILLAVNAYLGSAESLSEYELKTIPFEKIDKSRSYLTHDKHQALFDALLNSMSLDDAIARGQADLEKILKKRDRDDEDPSGGPNQGKKTKRSRIKEFEPSTKSFITKETSN
nr:hypothetical protein [Tanacetum cinerariifolium]